MRDVRERENVLSRASGIGEGLVVLDSIPFIEQNGEEWNGKS
jgi:hypothetical protein